MNNSFLNTLASRRGLFGALLVGAFMLCSGYHASAQFGIRIYQGTLSIKGSLAHDCAVLTQGDQATISVAAFFGDAIFRKKMNMGDYAFSTVTTSGVLITGVGTLVAYFRGGQFVIHEMSINGVEFGSCYLPDLDLKVGVKAQ